MPRSKSRKKVPKRVLALPDLEHAKTAVLNSRAVPTDIPHFAARVVVTSARTLPSSSRS
jgi:hypothetical protein